MQWQKQKLLLKGFFLQNCYVLGASFVQLSPVNYVKINVCLEGFKDQCFGIMNVDFRTNIHSMNLRLSFPKLISAVISVTESKILNPCILARLLAWGLITACRLLSGKFPHYFDFQRGYQASISSCSAPEHRYLRFQMAWF